ncbi:MAG: glycosyltransferase family A protein [Algoriphagus sp.]|uniref:glycosyltransferase family 2 protein n=1 Tax=Algoriphagus sp. TaxID=1872435 RepID=UPI002623D457|nr:glycosyltransferase family A protein [Algoriphagus sp.]MDG1277528.1 glycosyltransferase family A protein [Algoriphagus sp.]
MSPKISVVIPFYNGAKTLNRAVESVMNQSFEDWELILVDDGSIDESAALANQYLSDSRIRYIFQENQGVSAARNHGALVASGEWLIFLDADDELKDNAIFNFSAAISSDTTKDYWIAGIERVKDGLIIKRLPKKGIHFSKIPGTFCLRKKLFQEVGGYDILMKFSENTELFHRLELIKRNSELLYKVSLVYYDSTEGASKNLQNMVDSLSWFLGKHKKTLSSHVKHLFNQIIGVNYLRFGDQKKARIYLRESLKYKFRLTTLIRYLISFSKPINRVIYKK